MPVPMGNGTWRKIKGSNRMHLVGKNGKIIKKKSARFKGYAQANYAAQDARDRADMRRSSAMKANKTRQRNQRIAKRKRSKGRKAA